MYATTKEEFYLVLTQDSAWVLDHFLCRSRGAQAQKLWSLAYDRAGVMLLAVSNKEFDIPSFSISFLEISEMTPQREQACHWAFNNLGMGCLEKL